MDKIDDCGLVIDWINWGNPWHGVVANTTLTLPDSSTRTVPAAGTGACFLSRVPGATGASLSDDAIQPPPGGEWRDYVLLYGANGVIYGQVVSTCSVHWVFVRPSDGSRWLIELTNPDPAAADSIALNGDPLTLYFKATQFGDLVRAEDNGGPVVVEFNITLEDRGLANSYSFDMPTAVYPGISDILPDGSKCCLMYYVDADSGNIYSGKQRLPYGFLEVTIDPDVFADSSVALIHDIEAVFGSRTTAAQSDSGTGSSCSMVDIDSTVTPAAVTSIIAVWYVAGTLESIYWKLVDFAASCSYTLMPTSPWTCDPLDVSMTDNYEYQVKIGSDTFEYLTIDITRSYSASGTYRRPADGGSFGSASLSYTEKVNGTTTFSYSDSFTGAPAYNGDLTLSHAYWYGTDFHPWATQSLGHSSGYVSGIPNWFTRILSPTLIAVGWAYTNGSGEVITKIEKYFTPQGSLGVSFSPTVDTEWRDLVGSFQPVTQEIVIADDGVIRSFV